MFSVTSDTNIYISAFEFGGHPRRFLELADAGDFRLDISDAILNEILRVLREKFHWAPQQLRKAELDVRSYSHYVRPSKSVNVITLDPSDNRILECASAAKSDFIVSGDKKHLLSIRNYEGIRIVTVMEFLDILNRK